VTFQHSMDNATVPHTGQPTLTLDSPRESRGARLRASLGARRIGLGLLFAAACAAAGLAVHTWFRAEVVVTPVVLGTALDAVYGAGTVEAAQRVAVKARVAGPVTRLLVREGDAVEAGALIGWIDAPVLRHEVVRSESDVAAARGRVSPQTAALRAHQRVLDAQLSQARLELRRAEGSAKLGMSAEQDLERAKLQVALLEGQGATNRAELAELQLTSHFDARRAEAGLASSQARASDAEVRAPIAGTVLSRYVELGEVVAVNQDLCRIGDTAQLRVEAIVDEADIGRVRVGMPAALRITAFQAQTARGKVERISPAAQPGLRGFRVEIGLVEAVEGLRPGMSAECNIIVEQHEGALLAPFDATHGDHVWVVGPDHIARRRAVRSGLRDLGRVELTQGVSAGELLVLGSEAALSDGQKVSPQMAFQGESGH
jgi:HlyD family secretion protein